MIQGMIGKKMGMSQIFADDGRVIPVTVIKAGPCVIVQRRTPKPTNQVKVQLGYVEDKPVKKVTKPLKGHFDKAKVPVTRILREFFLQGNPPEDQFKVGDTVKVDIFQEKEIVNVLGTTKGKGFQGVVRRHGYSGGRATHGSMFHRAPGSIGSNTYPGRVFKNKGMPGRMGGRSRTIKGLEVVKIDKEKDLLLIKGAVPGFAGNYVCILKDRFARR